MKLLSDLYNVTLKKDIRGKAKEGFVRPTIGENFMTHKDFVEIPSFTPPPTTIGEFVEGGYYFGTIEVSGTTYYLVCSDKASGETRKAWGDRGIEVAGADSLVDGYQNTIDLEAGTKPAADFCRDLTIGGYNDWYLPAKDELNLLYQNHAALEAAGAGIFVDNSRYWTSTEDSAEFAWNQRFYLEGDQAIYFKSDNTYYVRAIRRFTA